MAETEKKRLQVNVELQDEEVDRFLKAKEKLRARTNAGAGYALLMARLDVVVPEQNRESKTVGSP